MRTRFPVSRDGFSLLEVMVGSAIGSIVILALLSAVDLSSRVTRTVLLENDYFQLLADLRWALTDTTICTRMLLGKKLADTPTEIELATTSLSLKKNGTYGHLTFDSVALAKLADAERLEHTGTMGKALAEIRFVSKLNGTFGSQTAASAMRAIVSYDKATRQIVDCAGNLDRSDEIEVIAQDVCRMLPQGGSACPPAK